MAWGKEKLKLSRIEVRSILAQAAQGKAQPQT